jgi:hypothetical protein
LNNPALVTLLDSDACNNYSHSRIVMRSFLRIVLSVHSRIYIKNLVIQCSLFYVPTQPLYILKQIKSKSSIYFVYLEPETLCWKRLVSYVAKPKVDPHLPFEVAFKLFNISTTTRNTELILSLSLSLSHTHTHTHTPCSIQACCNFTSIFAIKFLGFAFNRVILSSQLE